LVRRCTFKEKLELCHCHSLVRVWVDKVKDQCMKEWVSVRRKFDAFVVSFIVFHLSESIFFVLLGDESFTSNEIVESSA
jgi:hypothetical protein